MFALKGLARKSAGRTWKILRQKHCLLSTTATCKFQDKNELLNFASLLAEQSRGGDTFFLEGECGVGKTEIARRFIRHKTGVEFLEVVSPSFTINITYEHNNLNIHHMDLYRLDKPVDTHHLKMLGLTELLGGGKDICLVEWPNRLSQDDIPTNRIQVQITDFSEWDSEGWSGVDNGGSSSAEWSGVDNGGSGDRSSEGWSGVDKAGSGDSDLCRGSSEGWNDETREVRFRVVGDDAFCARWETVFAQNAKLLAGSH